FPGECIGIIGESGSGKSTLVKALMQMVDYQGEIYIGEENCKNLSLYILRKYIAYSPEHSDIFPATVHENIQYGNL
ncbi:ABC transporter ATP-binding protein, partial [Klebsiella oxytoca]